MPLVTVAAPLRSRTAQHDARALGHIDAALGLLYDALTQVDAVREDAASDYVRGRSAAVAAAVDVALRELRALEWAVTA